MSDLNIDVEYSVNLQDEDPPPILVSGIRDIFHIFVNMLDVKSFMKLAMTSKDMYKRCMNDRRIEVNLKEKEVVSEITKRVRSFCFESYKISVENIERYFEKLCQMKFNVSLKTVHLQGTRADRRALKETRDYLKELGVRAIDSLKIDGQCTGLRELSFIKDFHIKNVDIDSGLPDDVLLSLLQSNLSSFTYNGRIQAELLLQVNSPIPQIVLSSVRVPSSRAAVVFKKILEKIQTGALKKLYVDFNRIPWSDFTSVSSEHDRPLPAERPLLIEDSSRRWFLHWNGNVTKCDIRGGNSLIISKCEQDKDLPAVLKSKENVHKELAKKRKTVRCLKSHFTSFFGGIPVLHELHRGPCPNVRPLLSKIDDNAGCKYYFLNEDGSVDVYHWNRCVSRRSNYDLNQDWPKVEGHPALLKFLVKKRIEKCVKGGSFECGNIEIFHFLFEDYETLPHDFKGELPDRRPLVFGSSLVMEDGETAEKKEDHRVVLYEDGILVQYRCNSSGNAKIELCRTWNRPSVMITRENLRKIAVHAPLKKLVYNIGLAMFRAAFGEANTISYEKSERAPVFKKNELREDFDERWILLKYGDVRKCEWKDGMATFLRGNPREFPPILTKSIVTQFLKGKQVNIKLDLYIDRDSLDDCLPDCELLLYNYSGPIPSNRPLIFKKSEIKHACQGNPNDDCECSGELLHFCFVSDKEDVIYMTWGAKEDRSLSLCDCPNSNDLPAVLKTKEMLEFLLLSPWKPNEVQKVAWYGSSNDLVGYFESHKVVDFNAEGPLPEERPLVFKNSSRSRDVIRLSHGYWFLREDGLLIRCGNTKTHILLTINPKHGLPPAISSSY